MDVSVRYLATPELALTPRIHYTPGQSLVVSPELHATRSFGNLLLTLNAGVRPMLDLNGGGLTSATGFACLSGSYFLSLPTTSAPFQYATSVTYAMWYAASFSLWEK
ncbi:hypothetical protein JQX13_52450 [Archangium violaceum]|nr:hypothetical protein JQX13_52450 [Archangium violaceum]